MAYYNNREGYTLNEEQVVSFLKETLKRVENASEADIKTLAELKKLFKKTIPFSRRGYVAALLIKEATRGFRSNRVKNEKFNRQDKPSRQEKSEHTERNTEERPERAPRVTIAEDAAGTIFISVGRSRGVYPRDLVGLLVSVAGFDRSRIGEIKVLSNYSFVQLFAEDCDKAISALNNYEYRGRKLSVSYSAKKEKTSEAEEVKEAAPAVQPAEQKETSPAEDVIPSYVSNEGHAVPSENVAEQKLAAEQTEFAKSMSSSSTASDEKPYSETTDDGQVKSHFGDGAAY